MVSIMEWSTRILFFLFLISNLGMAQSSKFKILLKGGVSDYGGVQGLQVSSSGGPGDWKVGPVFGLGTEYYLGKNWFAQGTVEYSTNIYGATVHYTESLERGHNSVLDFMVNLKKRWSWFYLISGVGYSVQNSTDSYSSGYFNGEKFRQKSFQGSSTNVLTGLIGIGVEFYLFEDVAIFLEGSWRLRKYVSAITELGFLYKL